MAVAAVNQGVSLISLEMWLETYSDLLFTFVIVYHDRFFPYYKFEIKCPLGIRALELKQRYKKWNLKTVLMYVIWLS